MNPNAEGQAQSVSVLIVGRSNRLGGTIKDKGIVPCIRHETIPFFSNETEEPATLRDVSQPPFRGLEQQDRFASKVGLRADGSRPRSPTLCLVTMIIERKHDLSRGK